jgi:hypothetical protein
MQRTIRFRAPSVLVLTLTVLFAIGTGAGAAPTAAPSGPVLTIAAMAPGSIAVAGRGFTPGGRVYVALFDVWGTTPYATRYTPRDERWTAASASAAYGRDGSADPAAGYAVDGTIDERLTGLCGATWMIAAYDEATEAWTGWLAIDPSDQVKGSDFGPDGGAGPALGHTPGC